MQHWDQIEDKMITKKVLIEIPSGENSSEISKFIRES